MPKKRFISKEGKENHTKCIQLTEFQKELEKLDTLVSNDSVREKLTQKDFHS